jgi:calcium-dependent protein kinase
MLAVRNRKKKKKKKKSKIQQKPFGNLTNLFFVKYSDNGIVARYTIGETTRRGDFFVIKSATAKANNTAVSIKAIDIGTAQMLGQSIDALAREIELFQLCKDAYVCAALEVVRGDSSLCMALESIAGAPLNVQLARGAENYTEADARRLVGQISHAVAAVHKAGVAHRDIVPDNFVFTSKTDIASVKLCDFSFAVRLASPATTTADTPGGDPEFQAPEIAREAPNGMAADTWSLGCLAHLLIAGDTPLHDSNTTRLRMKIGKGDVTVGAAHASWPKNVSKAADAFVRALLVADAAKRPQLAAVLAHPWLAAKDDVPLSTFKAQLKNWNDTR